MAIGDIYTDKWGRTYTEKPGELMPLFKEWNPEKRRFIYYRRNRNGRIQTIPLERVATCWLVWDATDPNSDFVKRC